MKIYPKKYSKEEFIKFLKKNNVNDKIITKFVELPETVIHKGNEYDLYINSTWYNVGNTHYNFELNYYSEDLVEYLFNSKVFGDVEISINNLLCELMNSKLIDGICKK
jgi:hypothetical protein